MAHSEDNGPSVNMTPAWPDSNAALAHFHALLAAAPIGLGLLDENLRYVHVNSTLAAINGQPAEAHIGRTMREVIPHIAVDLEGIVRRVFDTGEMAFNLEWGGEVPGRPGEHGHWLVSYYPVHNRDGRMLGVGIVVIEITAQKRAERALRASEARYRGLVESQQELIARVDPEGRLTFVNDSYCRSLGLNREDAIGTDFKRLVHEDDLPRILEEFRQLSEHPPHRGIINNRARTPSGWRWFEWEAGAILDDQGRMIEVQAVGRDITERLEAELALATSEKRYRAVVESQQDLIARITPDAILTFVNDAYCNKLSVSREQVIGKSFLPRIHADDHAAVFEAIEVVRKPPYRATAESRMITPEGWRWFEWEGGTIRDERGAMVEVQCVGRDVTERRATELALRESLEKIEMLARQQVVVREEERRRLGFDLHDDVCQELLGIRMLVESILEHLGPVPAKITADFGRVVRHLGEMTERVRGLAQELQPIVLRDLGLEGALRSLAEKMSSESVQVVTQLKTPVSRLPEEIEVAVYRVVKEALSNAVRHASPRSVVVMLTAVGGTLHLEVSDDGRGFDTAKRPGALGLLGMEERALAIGARFTLRSEPGKGTTVSMDCPLP